MGNHTYLKKSDPGNRYSSLAAFFSILFSFYGVLRLYLDESVLWIPLSMAVFIAFLSILVGIDELLSIIDINSVSSRINFISFLTLRLGFFVSTVYGLLIVVSELPLKDHSITAFPVLVLIIIFGGVSVGLFQEKHTR